MKTPSQLLPLILALAVPILLSNCSSKTGQSNNSASTDHVGGSQYQGQASVQQPEADEKPGAARVLASAEPTDYKISPYDSLQITVFQVQDLNQTVLVNADGSISLPLIGKLVVVGKTAHETEQIIGDRLRKKYLQSPQVTVSVAKFGQRVTVSGAVKGPRVLAVDGQLTLTQAVANAGGLSDLADSSRVHLARKGAGQRVQDEVFNLDAIEAGKAPDPMLRGGDLVVAEQSGVRVAFKEVKDVLPFAIIASLF